jgi:methylase of polypeptide subunit release factors
MLLGKELHYIGTDINPMALDASRRTAEVNNSNIDLVQTCFADNLRGKLQRKVDILIFNPVR